MAVSFVPIADRNGEFALVLVNRIMHRNGGEGIDLISRIKGDPQLSRTPTMLISDFDDYQQRAVQIGAEPGFGKNSLHSPETKQRLAKILDGTDANSTI